MENKTDTAKDVITIVAEPGALTFATRKEWQRLPEYCLGEITQHKTELVFTGTNSIFFLLKDMNIANWAIYDGFPYRLVKISIDEDGKQVFHIMTLSKAEADQMMRNKLSMWE